MSDLGNEWGLKCSPTLPQIVIAAFVQRRGHFFQIHLSNEGALFQSYDGSMASCFPN